MPPVMSNKGEKEEGGGKKETEDSEKKSEVEILKARLEAAEGRVRAEQEQVESCTCLRLRCALRGADVAHRAAGDQEEGGATEEKTR